MEPDTNDNDVETIVDTTNSSITRQVVPSTPNLQNYRSEASRLESFWNWNHPYPMPADLASAGFIFTGSNFKSNFRVTSFLLPISLNMPIIERQEAAPTADMIVFIIVRPG